MSTAKKPPVWGKKAGRGHSVRLLLAKPYLGVRQDLPPALFVMPGGELIKRRAGTPGKNCKEVLASSQFRVLINSHEKQTSWSCSGTFQFVQEKESLESCSPTWECWWAVWCDSNPVHSLAYANHHLPAWFVSAFLMVF